MPRSFASLTTMIDSHSVSRPGARRHDEIASRPTTLPPTIPRGSDIPPDSYGQKQKRLGGVNERWGDDGTYSGLRGREVLVPSRAQLLGEMTSLSGPSQSRLDNRHPRWPVTGYQSNLKPKPGPLHVTRNNHPNRNKLRREEDD